MEVSDVTAFQCESVTESLTGRLRWLREGEEVADLQQEIQRVAYVDGKPERVSYVWRTVPVVDQP